MFKLGMIGGGAMGSALINGIIKTGVITPENLFLVEIDPVKREALQKNLGIKVKNTLSELAKECPNLVLAVKPAMISSVLQEIRPAIEDHLVISIAAGVTLATLESQLPKGRFVRVMPNILARIGQGVAAYAGGQKINSADREKVETIFKCVGKVLPVGEHLMDVVTAVSGSGPAFVYYFMESLIDAGVMLGLSRPDAQVLVVETVLGSAEMLKQTLEHPAKLRNDVTSAGGTTAAGLFELEKGAFKGILMQAVRSATERSKELGRN